MLRIDLSRAERGRGGLCFEVQLVRRHLNHVVIQMRFAWATGRALVLVERLMRLNRQPRFGRCD